MGLLQVSILLYHFFFRADQFNSLRQTWTEEGPLGSLLLMNIKLNGDPLEVPQGHTLANLILDLAVGDKRIAVEVNEEIVPRSTYSSYCLKPGDQVEVVTAIGGG